MVEKWSTEETFRFIELYQNQPSIWNPKDKCHKDKNKVNDSWKKIADEIGIPVVELKKKKETLMTAFRSHLKKKKASIRSGAGVDEVYKPIWVFYEAMEIFLKDIYQCKSIVNTEEEELHVEDCNEQYEDNRQTIYEDNGMLHFPVELHEEGPGPSLVEAPVKNSPKESLPKKKSILPVRKRRSNNPLELQDVNDKMSTAFTTLNEVLSKKKKDVTEDECALYGRLLGVKLRQFSSYTRNELMYQIDGIVMQKSQAIHSNDSSRSIPSSCSPTRSPRSSSPSPCSSALNTYYTTINLDEEFGDFQ